MILKLYRFVSVLYTFDSSVTPISLLFWFDCPLVLFLVLVAGGENWSSGKSSPWSSSLSEDSTIKNSYENKTKI